MGITSCHLVGIVGYSGSGKTTLIERLIPLIQAHGFNVGVIKHTHHQPIMASFAHGKDTQRYQAAGAQAIHLVAANQSKSNGQTQQVDSPYDHLHTLSKCDWVLVEGFKHFPFPKLEILHTRQTPLHPNDPTIMAIITDYAPNITLPCFQRDDAVAIVNFIFSQRDQFYVTF